MVALSLLIFVTEHPPTLFLFTSYAKDWFEGFFFIIGPLVFAVLGYCESIRSQKIYMNAILSSLLGSMLLLLNPTMWGLSSGNPAVPNWISILIYFPTVLIGSVLGAWILQRKK